MHIFCDESGGTSTGIFLVAAVRLDPVAAARAVRSFRKASGWHGEVKGHALDASSRRLLLNLAFRTPGSAAVVVCDDRTAVGGWAHKELHPESVLRTELMLEACLTTLAEVPGASCSMVTADGGRYPKAALDRERQRLEAVLRARGFLPRARQRVVTYGQSHDDAGLQIADVVANAVHRYLTLPGTRPDTPVVDGGTLLGPWLTLRHVALTGRRPDWLGPPSY